MTIDNSGTLVGLASDDRKALFLSNGNLTEELIPKPRPRFGGPLTRITTIQGRLYACGYWGQAYRRDDDGVWRLLHDDLPILIAAGEHDRTFHDIAGPDENQIYMAGMGGCWFFDGKDFRKLDGVPERLNQIFVASDADVWICGFNGALVRGNHRDGFRSALSTSERHSLFSVVKDDDQVWVGCTTILRLERGKLIPALDFMRPEPKINLVSLAGTALWGFGPHDIVRRREGAWDRVPFDPPWLAEPWPGLD